MKEAEEVPIEQLITVDPTRGIKILPHWLAQPYWRPLPPPARTLGLLKLMFSMIDDVLSLAIQGGRHLVEC